MPAAFLLSLPMWYLTLLFSDVVSVLQKLVAMGAVMTVAAADAPPGFKEAMDDGEDDDEEETEPVPLAKKKKKKSGESGATPPKKKRKADADHE